MPPMRMLHAVDPRDELMNKVGRLDHVEVFGNDILIAIYERPGQTKSGIHLPDKTRDEDKFQGKVGLVIKKGPLAFVPEGNTDFAGMNVEVGDWVCYRIGDGWSVNVDGVPFRMLQDIHIKLRVDQPDRIY